MLQAIYEIIKHITTNLEDFFKVWIDAWNWIIWLFTTFIPDFLIAKLNIILGAIDIIIAGLSLPPGVDWGMVNVFFPVGPFLGMAGGLLTVATCTLVIKAGLKAIPGMF